MLQNKPLFPTNVLDIVFEMLERWSIEKNVMHVKGLKINHDEKIKELTLAQILNKVEQKYTQLEG